MVERLKVALEDLTAVCILEGFQKQDHLMLVDTLGKLFDNNVAFCMHSFIRQQILTTGIVMRISY